MKNSSASHPRGAVSTSHHLATEAGARVLAEGGNAIDAALAAAAALCVVYPNNVALGGDLVALVRSPDGRVRFLNATGTAPSAQTREALSARHGSRLPSRGIDTVTVPGGVRGWQAMHELGATRPWRDHFDAAIRLAADGFPNSRSVAAALLEERDRFGRDPGAREIFYPGGEPIAEGEPLVQPALARTLTELAERGADDFYSGELAAKWVAGLERRGSRISLDDTAAYRAEWGEPLEGGFGGLRVLTGPPNTSGFILLRALNAVTAGIEDPLGEGAGRLAQAFRDGNAIRATRLADPAHGGASGEELVAMPAPPDRVSAEPKAGGDTVGFSAVSEDGWAVSWINSVYWPFGAQIVDPGTGILFQNRGTSFSLDTASPNVFAPGKRPRHTLMPVLVLDGDDPVWVPATMGGSAQPQIHTHLLLRVLDGAAPAAATHAPRWIVDEQLGSDPASVTVEADVSETAKRSLRAAGFTLTEVPPFSEELGHSNLIRVRDDGYEAASDPRSDGSAIVVDAG